MRANLAYFAYRFLASVTGRLPPAAGYWLARRIGWLLYYVSPGLRRSVSHNIRHVLGGGADEAQVQAVVRKTCVHMLMGHYDLFRMQRLTVEQIATLFRMEGYENLDRALEKGRGVIVISAHLGSLDIASQLPLIYDIPMTSPVQHIQPERLFRYILSLRQSHGLRFIPSDEPMIGLFRALKRGEMIILPCDRGIADSSREIEFFGAPARLPDGALRVAQRTGAPVVPAFAMRLPSPDNSFVVEILPEMVLPQTGDREADIAAGMEQVVALLERTIRRRPEQWLVAAPVWPMETE